MAKNGFVNDALEERPKPVECFVYEGNKKKMKDRTRERGRERERRLDRKIEKSTNERKRTTLGWKKRDGLDIVRPEGRYSPSIVLFTSYGKRARSLIHIHA